MTRIRSGIRSCWIFILVVGLVPVSALAQGTPESADETPSFLLEPVAQDNPYMALTMEPGTQQEVSVRLGIGSNATVSARTYAADAYTLVNGGFGVETEEDEVSAPTTWLDYSTSALELEPNQVVERQFTVGVPPETAPGEYITGIVVQTAEPIAVGESTMLRQTIRKAIAVVITVPGPVTPGLSIGTASLKQSPVANSVLIEIENTGNVLLKPTGTVTVTGPDGEPVGTSPVVMGSVYAGMATILELPVPIILAPGLYAVEVSLADRETGVTAEAAALSLAVAESAAATPAIAGLMVDAVTVAPVTDAASGSLQLVDITVGLSNPGGPVPSARLTLHVERDGELVEDYVLSPSLAVPAGVTTIQQRYVPASGWEPGDYTFAVTLELIDLNSGQATTVMTVDAAPSVTVPQG